jgi:hypothetical protein
VSEPSEVPRDLEGLGEGAHLLVPDRRLGIPVPAYGGRSLANLASGIGRSVGGATVDGIPLPGLAPELDPFDGRRPEGPVVVLLVDGLGWTALRGSAAREPSGPASRWVGRARALTSVFPTTTTVALTSLSSGAAPGQHGVVGHRVFLPRYDTVVEFLRMSPLGVSAPETLVGPDWTPSSVSAVPSIFRRGIRTVAVSRDRYEGSGFTRLLYDGAEFAAYVNRSDFAVVLAQVLGRPNPPPLVFAYWDALDIGEHVRGPLPELVDLELEGMDTLLSFVSRRLDPPTARRTTVLITGDHGQVPMSPDHQLVADRDPELLGHLSHPPSGDRRATYFSARPGHLPALREALESRRPAGSHLLEMPEALDGGLYGPPPFHPEIRERLGDLLLLMPSPGGVSYTVPGSRPRGHPMRGAHGGLEPPELLVPLIAGYLPEVARPA